MSRQLASDVYSPSMTKIAAKKAIGAIAAKPRRTVADALVSRITAAKYRTQLAHRTYRLIADECPECGFPEADAGYCPECDWSLPITPGRRLRANPSI